MVETFLDRLAQYTFRSHLYSVSIIFSRVSNYLRGIFLLIWGILGDHIDIFGRLGGRVTFTSDFSGGRVSLPIPLPGLC